MGKHTLITHYVKKMVYCYDFNSPPNFSLHNLNCSLFYKIWQTDSKTYIHANDWEQPKHSEKEEWIWRNNTPDFKSLLKSHNNQYSEVSASKKGIDKLNRMAGLEKRHTHIYMSNWFFDKNAKATGEQQ